MIETMKQTHSATLSGYDAHPVSVEATFTRGLPSFSIVGLASSSIQESKERVKSALLCNGFTFPPQRITLNLSPSDLHKDGTQFDLAIALLIALYESNVDLGSWAIFGELGLDGSVKANSNLFALMLSFALQKGVEQVIVPQSAAITFAAISSIRIYPVRSLKEATAFLKGEQVIEPLQPQDLQQHSLTIGERLFHYMPPRDIDFIEVKGQEVAKRAALIAAAGGHNLLLEGNPGSGKSMIAKRLHSILPPLDKASILEIAKLQALEGKIPDFKAVRPMRSPHHSATPASIFGGGSRGASIGEAGLAHLGMLFFDELPHFSKQVLEALREPLEDKKILVSRVQSKTEYKTDFLFVAAMNPCPCGNLLSTQKSCRCSDIEIKRYKNRLSDPLLDRIDLYVCMQENHPQDRPSISSEQMQKMVFDAFTFAKQRDQEGSNSGLSAAECERFCALDPTAEGILEQAVLRYALSARSVDKVKKVARTIADLALSAAITKEHLLEALSYRRR